MLLIILLIIVVGVKYISFKEHFFCRWDANKQKSLRDKRQQEYNTAIEQYKTQLGIITGKQNTINEQNDALEKSLIDTNNKYNKILEENSNLIKHLNKTKINSDNCSTLNKMKLIAIKKIYS